MAVKYVRASGGSDSSNGASFANGWATLNYAFNPTNAGRVAAGDTLAVCGNDTDTTFQLTASVYITYAAAPTWANPVYIKAYDVSGNERTDGNRTKITTVSTLTNGLLYCIDTTNGVYTRFNSLLLDGGGNGKANYCMATASSGDFEGFAWDNCRFTNASSNGLNVQMAAGLGSAWRFTRCEIDNNGKSGGGAGLQSLNNASYGSYYMKGCKVHDNASTGIVYGDIGIFLNNLVYKNGVYGIYHGNSGSATVASIYEQNVIFGNSSTGLYFNSASDYPVSVVNNIFRSNGGYGIFTNGMDMDIINTGLFTNNCSHNNTSGHIDINGGVLPGSGNITSDPQFTTETAGSENFTLQSTSPCINAGYNPLGY